MEHNIKILLKVIMALLALATIVSLIYGISTKVTVDDAYSEYDEAIISAVDDAVLACRKAFNAVNATDEDIVNLNDYITNIENADSPVLKAYIADSMLTYTGDFLMVVDNKISNGIGKYTSANFNKEQRTLMNVRSELDDARNYNSKEGTTSAPN